MPVSAMKAGSECYCLESVPTNHLVHTEDKCDAPCAGDSNKLCGGQQALHFYIASKQPTTGFLYSTLCFAACDTPWKRFGDSCLLNLPPMSVVKAEDTCADFGGHLWYPDTEEELNYVTLIYG